MQNLVNPCKGKITSPFGTRIHPITKVIKFHNGVDIAVIIGTPILAPADGTVTKVWDHTSGGKCLAMVSDDGVRFGFAHLSRQVAVKGQKVRAGEFIAASGNTGASTAPHVHFTVKINGSWVDPMLHFTFK